MINRNTLVNNNEDFISLLLSIKFSMSVIFPGTGKHDEEKKDYPDSFHIHDLLPGRIFIIRCFPH